MKIFETIRRRAIAGVLAAAALALVACAHVPYAISKADRERFGKHLLLVHPAGKPDPLILGADGCKLYRAKIEHQDIVGWEVTLAADWGASYPAFMTVCTHETLVWDGKYVDVFFCAQAVGAGGGCANGGNYRSRTGARPWLVRRGNTWVTLPQ
jgi:hypothetical protein